MEQPSARQEWRTPPKYVVSSEANATDDVFDHAAARPDHPAFAREADGIWRAVTAKEFADEVTALAAGLMAAGVAPGDL
jgi:long-chain acyl-CoA synthetase